jgi:membrane-bound lytic murein transglycosylase D
MRRLTVPFSVALCIAFTSTSFVAAQTPTTRPDAQPVASRTSDTRAQAVIDRAQHLYDVGEQAFADGDLERSRRSFDDAVDAVLLSGIDVRTNEPLNGFYNELVEKIHKHQLLAQDTETRGFAEQAYVPAASELSELSDADLASLTQAGDTTIDGEYNFPFAVDAPVFQFITYFTSGRGRGTMESGLRRSGKWRKMAERIFQEEGVPTDLIWLAQVESVWKPAALSHAAAKGIWQFIPSTGRRFGLGQDFWVDERSDPEKSTRAAARYLKFLHNYFAGDWLLAMAAYNSGEGNVSKAIARSGYADFWEIHRAGFLPTETRNYVPAILAVVIVAHNQKRYGFNVTPESPFTYDLAQLPTQTDLGVIARLCNTSEEAIRELNPHLRRDATPPGTHAVRLPTGRKRDFEMAYAALSPEERLGRQQNVIEGDLAEAAPARSTSGFGGGNSTISYTARRGETLSSIATRHGVSPVELARVNKIGANDDLQAGQVLNVPSKTGARSRYVEQPVRKSTVRARDTKKSVAKKPASKKDTKKSTPSKGRRRG